MSDQKHTLECNIPQNISVAQSCILKVNEPRYIKNILIPLKHYKRFLNVCGFYCFCLKIMCLQADILYPH